MFLPGHVLRACLSTEEGPIEVQALSQSPRRKTYLVSDCITLKKVKEEAVLDSGSNSGAHTFKHRYPHFLSEHAGV